MSHWPAKKHTCARALASTAAIAVAALIVAAIVCPSASAQTYTVLHNFAGGADGAIPFVGLTADSAGNFYGTTAFGGGRGSCNLSGVGGCGTVFKLTHSGSSWIYAPLYQYPGGTDGAIPNSRAVVGPDGAVYGATLTGGQGDCGSYGVRGCGTVFRVTPPATFCHSVLCSWSESSIYRFTGGADGRAPLGDLVFDPSGSLYGSTAAGGIAGCGGFGCGLVFQLTRNGGSWMESVLYSFAGGADGYDPIAGVTFDNAGNIYGTTYLGGGYCAPNGCGSVFQLTRSGSTWMESKLHAFQGGAEGLLPAISVISDSAGNLYGATVVGGFSGGGAVFELSSSGGQWSVSRLYNFSGNQGPSGDRLVRDSAGNLYGTTKLDGLYSAGAVFKLTPTAGGWSYTSLYDFMGGSDGGQPIGGVVFGTDGNLYGTTSAGGSNGLGVVFQITLSQ